MRQASIYRSPISQEQRDQVKAYFEQHGINVADWARERNLAPRHPVSYTHLTLPTN